MKKILLIVFSALVFSANAAEFGAAEFFANPGKIGEFQEHVIKALLNEDNDEEFNALRRFMRVNNVLSEPNQDILKRRGVYGTLKYMTEKLDSRLFRNKNKVVKQLFPRDYVESNSDKNLERVVADFMEYASILDSVDVSFALVKHAYNKQKINVDKLFYSSSISDTVGDFIDQKLADGSSRAAASYWEKIADLVKDERNKDVPVEFSQESFVQLVVHCATEKFDIGMLKIFVKKVRFVPSIDEIYCDVAKCSLGSFLDQLNPDIFPKRDEVLRLIAPDRVKPENPMTGLAESEKKVIRETYVANIIRKCIQRDQVWPDLYIVNFVYDRLPICVDDFPGFHEGRTLGDEIDSGLGKNPNDNIYNLVGKKRTPRNLTEDQRREFIDLILKCLAAEKEDDQVFEKLRLFCGQNKINEAVSSSVKLELNLFGTKKKITVKDFIEKMSSNLFPHKKTILQEIFNVSYVRYDNLDQSSDKQKMHGLIEVSMDMPEFVPLAKRAIANYQSTYRYSNQIDINTLPYKATTVGKYLNENQHLAQYGEYKQLFPESFPKDAKPKDPKDEINKPKETAKPVAMWKKIALVAGAGVVAFVVYKYSQKTEKKSRTEIA